MPSTLVLGGIRSGKSRLAESEVARARGDGGVVYVATAEALDAEMQERIRSHQADRPDDWELVEEPLALARVLSEQGRRKPPPALLIDCMSLWLSNALHAGETDYGKHRDAFLDALSEYPGDVVIVSNEVGLGTIGMDKLTRFFADELGWLNQSLAGLSDRVLMSVAGQPLTLKDSGAVE
jgi:adenosylcobinamide kinase/adenosylcobinamide-phosphate guanylyltransferase